MAQEIDHVAFVADWMKQKITYQSKNQIHNIFRLAFDAFWERSFVTLGEITLSAIFDRVLIGATSSYPWLANITLGSKGFALDKLNSDGISEQDFSTGLKILLTDLLIVQGNLTANAITRQLQDELTKVNHAEVISPDLNAERHADPNRKKKEEDRE